jgi:hypothetical protein
VMVFEPLAIKRRTASFLNESGRGMASKKWTVFSFDQAA